MRVHLLCCLILAGCALVRRGPDASCTPQRPCRFAAFEATKARVEEEQALAEKADATGRVLVEDAWLDSRIRRLEAERRGYQKVCAALVRRRDELLAAGRLMTVEEVRPFTGPPEHSEVTDNGALAWGWHVHAPVSGYLGFGVGFHRLEESGDTWVFLGCVFCAEPAPGGPPLPFSGDCVMQPRPPE